ncbi:MAG TPA: M1 family aminopeptidase [bacterium]|nr:M1 family aminopeptidase [bacterium]HNL25444.1 M1 family aminopeptidase [bacterium]
MDVDLVPATGMLTGRQKIIYTNNSPDTLHALHMNLYVNAFRKNSRMHRYHEERDKYYGGSLISYVPEAYLGYSKVQNIRDEPGRLLSQREDDTLLEITLAEPIQPGGVCTLTLDFEVKIPAQIRRMGRFNREGVSFSIAQWYPKLCVYDHRGWHKNYYLAREFFGEFATWDVSITLPAHYIVGASGHLTNAENIHAMMMSEPESTSMDRVLSSNGNRDSIPEGFESVQRKLAEITRQQSVTMPNRTWRYHAEEIHDFAFAADPDYKVEIFDHRGMRVNLLCLPDVEQRWAPMKEWVTKIIDYMEAHVGRYPYPELTVAQAGDGGMEYPNIVFITGRRGNFSLASVTAHELIHNWFYGLLANDETHEAWFDEGITSYYTTRLMEHLFGRYANREYETEFQKKWFPREDARIATFTGWAHWVKQGYEEPVLTHSDYFKSDQSYSMATYYKGQIFMNALEYRYGRERLDSLMRDFFEVYQKHHTLTDDFKRFLEYKTGEKLDSLFDQWLNTTTYCDYGIAHINNSKNTAGQNQVKVKLVRHGAISMPVDLYLKLTDGSWSGVRIPARHDDPNKSGLKRWTEWPASDPTYTLTMITDLPVDRAEIDTSGRLPDIFRMNNRSGFLPKTEWHWQRPLGILPTSDTYVIEHRPSLWYNQTDAARIGWKMRGKWATDEHQIKAGVYAGTRSRTIDYEITYSTPMYSIGRQVFVDMASYKLDGVFQNELSFRKKWFGGAYERPPYYDVSLGLRTSRRFNSAYLNPGVFWEKGDVHVLTASLQWQPQIFDSPRLKMTVETSTFASDYTFTKADLTYYRPWVLKRNVATLESRIFAGFADGNVPVQDQFYLAGASPRQMFFNPWYRSRGTLPEKGWRDASGQRHIYYDGQGSMAGYADSNALGMHIIAINLDLKPANPLKPIIKKEILFITQFEPILFFDAGGVSGKSGKRRHSIPSLVFDAGCGFRYLPAFIPSWMGNYAIKAEFPLWVSDPSLAGQSGKSWAFRWLIGFENTIR